MANLQELIEQRAALERAISQAQQATRAEALAQIRLLMQENNLTPTDLVAATSSRKKTNPGNTSDKKPVAAKYRDADGNTWTGRGLKPKWLTAALAAGKSLEDFTV